MASSRSLRYTAKRGCPPGYHHRKAYYSSAGKYVEPRCIKAQTVYTESQANFRRRTQTARRNKLKGTRARLGLTKRCPPGMILRAPYTRKFSSTIRRAGFTVRRGDQVYRYHPKASATVVKAACIKDRGLPGKGPISGKGIAPLRQGDLAKYGYNAHKSESERHAALRKAVEEYTALGVFRKLDAVAKLTKRTAPEAHRIFKADRDWVQRHYTLKGSF